MTDLPHLDPYRFRIEVPDDVLDDLRGRLARTRWPSEPAAAPWRYGTDRAWLRGVVDHWLHRYDWRAEEARLNRLRQFRVPVDSLDLHVIVEPGSGPSPIPLLLLNGWPSSFVEFADVVMPLAHPERCGGDAADGFTVIVPSYPGFGFSDAPPGPIGARAIAGMLDRLVTRIAGPERYIVHGGDWGAIIGSWMAFEAPDRVAALHLNTAPLRQGGETLDLDPEERAYLAERARRLAGETGYQAIQSSKPQTLGYALTDSPVGLAGWILEKFHAWVVPGSPDAPPFAADLLLTNVMIHWLNGIDTANWIYCDLADGAAVTLPPGGRVAVPTALYLGGRDLAPPPPSQWVRRSYDLIDLRVDAAVGHFPAIEGAAEAQCAHLRDVARTYR